ncbi:MAG: 16S rRNA (cytosine(1402)-N(4))-methyltransferase [Omnitrophica WOR_2 bacterium RIFCSPHIGHO2_02_FULL_46_37]|nr:MAG: 16S rRNA (cytosine(1402)-N(4))-methyltransferase [Omnitrophica WOR_2 bacterium RIFCSPHIGHO2_02_FULL_46_37]OGX42192.1 MAG: 16S rRNA (cytosine(1402)-N(4))-methyltransferase [Omnitrophica WOR_2 bacterium RIFCSPLOWO2_02_FULL_45_28]
MAVNIEHIPVMCREAVEYLKLRPGLTIVDATIGTAGHAMKILEKITPGGRLIGIDRDAESLLIAGGRLKEFNQNVDLVHADFRSIDKILLGLNLKKIDGILFDLGASSYQLDSQERGFSFRYNAPLDMRMDKTSYILAYDLVNNLTEKEISDILWSFGQERWHNRIAKYLVRERARHPISTTNQLKEIVLRAIPYKFSGYQRIHPATRTFQALRIAVNRELEALSEALEHIPEFLKKGAVVCVISFHSLEDRLVKHNFRENAQRGIYRLMSKKPTAPTDEEIKENPRARSAKMRAAVRI